MRWRKILPIVLIIALVTVGILTFNDYLKKQKALLVAQEYLEQKYEQDMNFKNIAVGIEPGLYYVRFSPVTNSDILFEVLVNPDLTIPRERWDFGNSEWSADNYYLKHFEHCMEEYLSPDVLRIWGDDATIKVLDSSIGSFRISPELNEKINLSEMEVLIDRYWIYITVNQLLSEDSVNIVSNQILEFIQVIQNNGFTPDIISCRYNNSEGAPQSILFKNVEEISTCEQVIETIYEQWDLRQRDGSRVCKTDETGKPLSFPLSFI